MGSIDDSGHDATYSEASAAFSIFDIELSESHTPSIASNQEALLLSWLLVLLRTQEDGRASFEWSYRDQQNEVEHQVTSIRLSTEDVLPDSKLLTSIAEATGAVSHHIKANAPKLHTATSCEISLFVSSGSLSHNTGTNDHENSVVHLELQLYDGRLSIRELWRSDQVLSYTILRYKETLAEMVKLCILDPDRSLGECLRPTTHDLNWIWTWNHDLPPLLESCMHDIIAERASKHPEKVAIDSWDGTLTYGEVDQYSTQVCLILRESGIQHHDFVPVCFEKSRWTIIAVLAVMKAGATILMMDPSLPLARLQNMAEQVNAKVIVSSRMQNGLAATVLPEGKHFIVDADTFAHPSNSQALSELQLVPPTALMYIIFTSGSTGTPKGVKISHQTYTSSAIPRAQAVGYSEESRVLDFASYAFDVSIDSMLLTLGNGGCLCIPSDEDRLNDINGVIRRMKINYAGITPSVARILEHDVIASMSALGLGGEASAPRDVNLWGQETRIVIGYGPCECTIGCTVNSSAAKGRDYISIGPGNGAAIWIVNPNDHETLLPVGAVGELLVEGPIVGQGYLNDPDKTAAAFIQDPSWLLAGHNSHSGRRGRLYKTGDLGMYDPDGSGEIVFIGRKDTQVKLRGQRVELGEIESQLKSRLPPDANVIAEVIVPHGSHVNPTLVAFVAPHSSKVSDTTQLESVELPAELNNMVSNINEELNKVLPRYMIPNAYIPVNFIPSLISGKTDRKRLRMLGATVDLRQLDQPTQNLPVETGRELTNVEQVLRHAWSLVLKLEENVIRLDDNFFALGGDSLAIMRLVSVCRESGYSLSVISSISHPTFSAMASVMNSCEAEVVHEVSTFSLVSRSAEIAAMEASEACGVGPEAVEDIYPCTPTQESLITFSLKATKPYVAQRVACIPSHVEIDRFKNAWSQVVAKSPILRSRVVQLQDPGLQQAVIRESIHWRHHTNLSRYLEDDMNESMALGQNLARYAIVDDGNDGKRYMVWTIHHVLYDGWSEPIILQMVQNALKSGETEALTNTQMRNFVRFVRDTEEAAMQEFWSRELDGAVGPQFPRLPSRDFIPKPDSMIEHQINFVAKEGLPFTSATLIRGAWALVAAQHCGSDDVVFGETLTGRDISLPGVENILGPLIATVPIRVRINRKATVNSYLQTIQQATSARAPYQHMGMQYIRRVSQDSQRACEAPTGLVIQPEAEHAGNELGFGHGDPVREALHFNPYPLMLAFGLRRGGFRVCANFDSSIVSVEAMQRVLKQLEAAYLQLTKNLTRRVAQVSCVPEEDLNRIWRWNKTPPLSLDSLTNRLRAHSSLKQGAEYPRVAVPWVCDAYNPELLVPIGCRGELWLEGNSLPGESVEAPSWLVGGSAEWAGRSGRVQPTGDIVYLNPDNSLTYLGRKENLLSEQGHAMDFIELEAHFAEFWSSPRVAAGVLLPLEKASDDEKEQQDLIIVVEHGPPEAEHLELMFMRHEVTVGSTDAESIKMTICAEIPLSLATALKKLDKFIRDDFPSSLAPSSYIVVDSIPLRDGQINRSKLRELVSKIPPHVLDQLRDGLKKAWATSSAKTDLSLAEDILRSAWAKLLGTDPEQIDLEDNFFRLGGDSVMAMRLVSGLRAQGHLLSVADIFQNMRLRDAARVLKLKQVVDTKVEYQPFSTLGSSNPDRFLSEYVRPKLSIPGWVIKDACPVTDSQALDIRATITTPRTSVQYTMLYFYGDIDREQLVRAFENLVKTHDILRTVFTEHESTFIQVIVDDLENTVETRQADKDLKQFVTDLCAQDIETDFHLGSSFLRVFSVKGQDGQHCLILGLSHAQYDGISLPRLLEDLATLYGGGKVTDFLQFPAYMAQIHDKQVETKALSYWRDVLTNSSLTVLDKRSTSQRGEKGFFKETVVENYQPLGEITTANVLTAAWALVLARRSGTADVTFGAVTSGRGLDMSSVENVVGPCYQFSPVRVALDDQQWTAMDLMRFVQKQSAESAAYDFVGFDKLARLGECARWGGADKFFDSVVHHQDWDDSGTMDFAGREARLEISNPHGDAAYPLKAVSFLRDGELHVGVVGGEGCRTFVEEIQAELVGAVRELSSDPLGQLSLVTKKPCRGV